VGVGIGVGVGLAVGVGVGVIVGVGVGVVLGVGVGVGAMVSASSRTRLMRAKPFTISKLPPSNIFPSVCKLITLTQAAPPAPEIPDRSGKLWSRVPSGFNRKMDIGEVGVPAI